MNEEHTDLSCFMLIRRGNSHTSNGLILIKIGVTKSEQSAQLVHV
jgi:hypothetical protein